MSTILKALRRLEEEKSRGVSSARPLREEVASGPGEVPRRRRSWLPVAAMLLGAGLGASVWYVWPYERGGEPVRAVETAAAPQVEESAVTRRVPPGLNAEAAQVESQLRELARTGVPEDAVDAAVSSPSPDPLEGGGPPGEGLGPPDDAFASVVEVVERPAPEPRIAPVVPGAPKQRVIQDPAHVAKEPPAVTSRRAAVRAEAQASHTASAATQRPVATAPDRVADVSPPHPAERPAPQPAPTPERVVAGKSAPAAVAQVGDADSAVRVKRTQWHPDPARRSADLDISGTSESVREGDVVGDYVVTEIRPSGVVLSRDGQRIERGIGR